MKFKFILVALTMFFIVSCGSSETSSSQDTSQLIYIGDSFVSGDLEAKVSSVETRDRVGGEFFNKVVSDGGTYLVVRWEYKNISNQPVGAFDKDSLKLLDPQGNEYNPDIDATSSFATEENLNEKIFSDLNPGISVKGAEVFEVAKDKLSDDWKIKVGNTLVSLKNKPTNTPAEAAPVATPAEAAINSFSPSFDCAKVTTGPERLICSNAELSGLDVKLSQIYRSKLSSSSNKTDFKKAQIDWRKFKRDACSDVACLIASYKQRIEELK